MGHPSDKVVREELGEPACLTEYLWMGDVYCNLSYRAIYEAANKVRPRNAGTHIWKINAAWPSVVQQVFDWYLRCNGGYYGMRSACRPLHVQHSCRRSDGASRQHAGRAPSEPEGAGDACGHGRPR